MPDWTPRFKHMIVISTVIQCLINGTPDTNGLTLKVPSKVAADDTFIFSSFIFLCLAEDSYKRSSLIFSEKK